MVLQDVWRALPLGTSTEVPVLLASINVGTAAYTVRVTDMANIWVESLERKEICMRAWGENTSIDPSDTPENMNKFLDSLCSALDPSHPSHSQTSMNLSLGGSSGDDRDTLILKVTCQLPGLSPLNWPIHLKSKQPSRMATEFVLPLIEEHHNQAHEINHLTDMLAQKDAIIAKLLDKLEAAGVGLENVFNSLSSRKKVTRTAAEDKIRGLAPFDKEAWEKREAKLEGAPEDASSLLTQVLEGDGLSLRKAIDVAESPKLDSWWHEMKGTLHIPHRPQRSRSEAESKAEVKSQDKGTDDGDDDDFQVQELPQPQNTAQSKQVAKVADSEDISTASEDESSGKGDAEKKSPVITSNQTQPGRKIGRLGKIGQRKQPSPQRSPSPPPSKVADAQPTKSIDGSDTASGVSDEEVATAAKPSPPAAPTSNVPSRGRIGRIGGRREPRTTQPEAANVGQSNEIDEKVTAPSQPPKLGMIGKVQSPSHQHQLTIRTKIEAAQILQGTQAVEKPR
jgi:hypothetical protein